MTSLCVLIQSAVEAEAALVSGADRLLHRTDQVDGPGVLALRDAVQGRCPLALWWIGAPDVPALPPCTGIDDLRFAFNERSAVPFGTDGVRRIGVLPLVDATPACIDRAVALGLDGLMIADGGGRLVSAASLPVIADAIRRCRARDLSVALAGGVEPPDIPRLLALWPDEIVVDMAHLRAVRDLMPRADRRQPPVPRTADLGYDVIFVRDWVIDADIGAYRHERGVKQRVRFTVEAEVARRREPITDLRHVVSYDLITDAIARLTRSHVDLVETLAEEIAAAVLAHPRIGRITVEIEKLDLGPGSLGCRIVRTRGGS